METSGTGVIVAAEHEVVSNLQPRSIRLTSVVASLTAGGIGPVCRYAAHGIASRAGWDVTLLSLHDPPTISIDEGSRLKTVCLGLKEDFSRRFLYWLRKNPQDLLITSDVSLIEPAFRFIPPEIRHVIQVHDSGRRYRNVAIRHSANVDGVTCVGRHIEGLLRRELKAVGFQGLLKTVHNGANFPPPPIREAYAGLLRLLFMGRVESLKGVFDLPPLLSRLRKLGVPFTLTIVGGDNARLRMAFEKHGLSEWVTWTGLIQHDQCYAVAAAHDVFLMTSRKESFGMATVEAMCMGCVPIAYDFPSGSTEIIEHGKSGLLIPVGNLRIWAERIRQLHRDRNLLAELRVGAMERARSHFNSATLVANLTAYLRDVIASSALHPSCREIGEPPSQPALAEKSRSGYQRLPLGLREWIRNQVCACPRLSVYLLGR